MRCVTFQKTPCTNTTKKSAITRPCTRQPLAAEVRLRAHSITSVHRPTKLPVQLQHCSSLGPGGRLKNAKKRQVWPTASNVRKFKIAKFWDPAVCANILPNCEDVGVFSLNQELVVEDWALLGQGRKGSCQINFCKFVRQKKSCFWPWSERIRPTNFLSRTNQVTNKVSPLCTKRRERTTAPVGQTMLPSHWRWQE